MLFGATGDLAKRMVIPAFFELARHDLLPRRWALIGNGRGSLTDEEFRDHVREVLTEFGPAPADGPWDDFSAHLRFAGGGFSADDPGDLPGVLDEVRDDLGDAPRLIHYLAVPPTAFMTFTEGLKAHDLVDGSRVVYEKPFGTSPHNFRELNDSVHEIIDEDAVYRIDHFLGKEATQNLHVLRFGNRLFDGIWNRDNIRAVQIEVPETLDIDDRGEFYDATGAFLDMIVTHLFQLAAEIAMEPPLSMHADDLQEARESVIAAFRPLAKDEVVFGQFDGYHDTEGVESDSTQNTLVAARLWIDTDRWRDVPFLLRTGKQMPVSAQKVSLIFRKPDGGPLAHDASPDDNVLTLDLSDDGEIDLSVLVKRPGASFAVTRGSLALPLASVANADPLPPYAKLIHDVTRGDRSLFTKPNGLESAWRAVAPILDDPPETLVYERGTWGPAEADALAQPDGWLATNWAE